MGNCCSSFQRNSTEKNRVSSKSHLPFQSTSRASNVPHEITSITNVMAMHMSAKPEMIDNYSATAANPNADPSLNHGSTARATGVNDSEDIINEDDSAFEENVDLSFFRDDIQPFFIFFNDNYDIIFEQQMTDFLVARIHHKLSEQFESIPRESVHNFVIILPDIMEALEHLVLLANDGLFNQSREHSLMNRIQECYTPPIHEQTTVDSEVSSGGQSNTHLLRTRSQLLRNILQPSISPPVRSISVISHDDKKVRLPLIVVTSPENTAGNNDGSVSDDNQSVDDINVSESVSVADEPVTNGDLIPGSPSTPFDDQSRTPTVPDPRPYLIMDDDGQLKVSDNKSRGLTSPEPETEEYGSEQHAYNLFVSHASVTDDTVIGKKTRSVQFADESEIDDAHEHKSVPMSSLVNIDKNSSQQLLKMVGNHAMDEEYSQYDIEIKLCGFMRSLWLEMVEKPINMSTDNKDFDEDVFFILSNALEMAFGQFRENKQLMESFNLHIRGSLRTTMELIRCITYDLPLSAVKERCEMYDDPYTFLIHYVDYCDMAVNFWESYISCLDIDNMLKLSIKIFTLSVISLPPMTTQHLKESDSLAKWSNHVLPFLSTIIQFFACNRHQDLLEYLMNLAHLHERLGIPSHLLADMAEWLDQTFMAYFDEEVYSSQMSDAVQFVFSFVAEVMIGSYETISNVDEFAASDTSLNSSENVEHTHHEYRISEIMTGSIPSSILPHSSMITSEPSNTDLFRDLSRIPSSIAGFGNVSIGSSSYVRHILSTQMLNKSHVWFDMFCDPRNKDSARFYESGKHLSPRSPELKLQFNTNNTLDVLHIQSEPPLSSSSVPIFSSDNVENNQFFKNELMPIPVLENDGSIHAIVSLPLSTLHSPTNAQNAKKAEKIEDISEMKIGSICAMERATTSPVIAEVSNHLFVSKLSVNRFSRGFSYTGISKDDMYVRQRNITDNNNINDDSSNINERKNEDELLPVAQPIRNKNRSAEVRTKSSHLLIKSSNSKPPIPHQKSVGSNILMTRSVISAVHPHFRNHSSVEMEAQFLFHKRKKKAWKSYATLAGNLTSSSIMLARKQKKYWSSTHLLKKVMDLEQRKLMKKVESASNVLSHKNSNSFTSKRNSEPIKTQKSLKLLDRITKNMKHEQKTNENTPKNVSDVDLSMFHSAFETAAVFWFTFVDVDDGTRNMMHDALFNKLSVVINDSARERVMQLLGEQHINFVSIFSQFFQLIHKYLQKVKLVVRLHHTRSRSKRYSMNIKQLHPQSLTLNNSNLANAQNNSINESMSGNASILRINTSIEAHFLIQEIIKLGKIYLIEKRTLKMVAKILVEVMSKKFSTEFDGATKKGFTVTFRLGINFMAYNPKKKKHKTQNTINVE